ncbi:YheC/YheD family protein [Paenibacillus brevis]|uniref:YheC/YheD family endospore coat-associated protein n=1 Tax=Paenibacillus brevis TaxID=2841508 RepID=UPI00201B04F9|nr:YheC/YheD family protein [Paenibacillus brevis]
MINKRARGMLGILVREADGILPFSEADFCRRLCLIGQRRGMKVYVFTPSSVSAGQSSIRGFCFENGSWQQRMYAPPDIVYDRCFSYDRRTLHRKHIAMKRLAGVHQFSYLTRGLSGKWNVHRALLGCPELVPYLPDTLPYRTESQLELWLDSHQGEAFLKPQHGTHGKRTLHIISPSSSEKLLLTGRDGQNQILHRQFHSRQEGLNWIHSFIANRPYIMQAYLELVTSGKEPFDIRALMQKNAQGCWELTGMAARIGAKETLTSNLHGGGVPREAESFLRSEFGIGPGSRIADTVRELSGKIPVCLESRFGRLAELGIDFGVDRSGKVWVLETNSKPGRSSFFRIGDAVSARKSFENPILYARYLLLSKP